MIFCSDVQLEHFENMTNKKLMIFILSNTLLLTFTPKGGDGLLSTGRVFSNCGIAMFWINNANPTSITINRTCQNHYYNGKIRLLKLKIRVFKKRVFYLVRHFDEGNINIFHQSKLFSVRCSLYVPTYQFNFQSISLLFSAHVVYFLSYNTLLLAIYTDGNNLS